jgi:hypothetical protein
MFFNHLQIGGSGKSPLIEDEDDLAMWIMCQRESGVLIRRNLISKKALELFGEDLPEFKASSGWVTNFLNRWNFVHRRATNVGQGLPVDLDSKLLSFWMYLHSVVESGPTPISPSSVGNMDETAIWIDMPGNVTIESVGKRTVHVKTTGKDRHRFTVVLSAMASGKKLKPFVIFKGK